MSSTPPTVWAYTYQLTPPQPPERLRALRALIAKERRAAKARAGLWEGRMVADDRIANLLVLSDSPDLDDDVNQRIVSALRELDAEFAVTIPLAVSDHALPKHRRPRKRSEKPK